MNLKVSLIFLTIVSVVCDTMVLPFYPQFFEQNFAVTDPMHTGYYIAMSCITVMCMFPLWARVAKRINELHLWVYTQIAAGCLGISCFFVNELWLFWVLSQLMLLFKASYLLIYPFVMRLEAREKHLNVASLFAVLMHFGAIAGALIGGAVLEWLEPSQLYLIMAAGDFIQVIVCLLLIHRFKVKVSDTATVSSEEKQVESNEVIPSSRQIKLFKGSFITVPSFVIQIGILSLIFYFAAFSIRPFLSLYWESISNIDNQMLSGLIYSIPGWVALIGLYLNRLNKAQSNCYSSIAWSLVCCLLGAMVQSTEEQWLFVLGRMIFAWGLFQATVNFEVLLFQLSKPEDFSRDYSHVHLFQNIGVIIASFVTAYLVANIDPQWSFIMSSILFVFCLCSFVYVYRRNVFDSSTTKLSTKEI
ncbi:MFS transporter [Pleionea litopenaei]|uniref:MFS transporter n=1 Tax=Pleionea litopenaei TaxID=3070815 RepID=A0AA51RSB1_9GAMM|nr:MFS transporter [Pleionea sp. HL-JVS1]WMS86748.1 MFS transporter [Pleionea sp. HL-JVS1]